MKCVKAAAKLSCMWSAQATAICSYATDCVTELRRFVSN